MRSCCGWGLIPPSHAPLTCSVLPQQRPSTTKQECRRIILGRATAERAYSAALKAATAAQDAAARAAKDASAPDELARLEAALEAAKDEKEARKAVLRQWDDERLAHDRAAHPSAPFPLGRLLEAAARVEATDLTRLGDSYLIWWVWCVHVIS